MQFWKLFSIVFIVLCTACTAFASKEDADTPEIKGDLSVMVLGSGGPVAASAGRASSSYLIFVDGEPTILMDAGGGSFKNLARSGVNIKDLDIILLSHLHVDHMADVSAFIKTAFFHNRAAGTFRKAPFHIFGPEANGIPFPNTEIAQYPSLTEFADGMYKMESGAERYLNIFSKAINGGEFAYKMHDVSADLEENVKTVFKRDGLVVKAIAVRHGPVPATAYRIQYKGKSIVFSGDTNSSTDNMIKIAMDSDLLIYDTAILDDAPEDKIFFALHTTPTRMGQVAAAAKPKMLLLSHITPVTEPHLNVVKKTVKKQGFNGKVKKARDLMVINLDKDN